MEKYECPCGYVYDPAEGDYENNVDPGTPFEDLPDDWVCPKCGAEKEYFEKVDQKVLEKLDINSDAKAGLILCPAFFWTPPVSISKKLFSLALFFKKKSTEKNT